MFAAGKPRDDASEHAVSVGADGNVKHWLVQTRSTVEGESLKGVPVTAMAFTQRGAKDPPALLCGSRDGRVFTVPLTERGNTLDMDRSSEFWRTETNHPLEESKSDQPVSESVPVANTSPIGICEDRGAYDSVRAIAISSDGEYTAMAIDEVVTVHCTSTGFDFKLQGNSEKRTLGPRDIVRSVQGEHKGQTGKVIRIGRQDASRVKVDWDPAEKRRRVQDFVPVASVQLVTAGPAGQPVCALAFHPQKPVLACAGWTGNIVLYNVKRKRKISQIAGEKTGQELSAIAFGLSGDLLAAVGYQGVVNIYRTRDVTRPTLVAQVVAHTNWTLTCALSHTTPMIVSAGLDGVVAVSTSSTSASDEWSVCQRFRGHKGAVHSVAVMASEDTALNDCIVSCGQDRSVRVWSLLEGMVAIFFCDSPVRSLVLPTVTADQLPRIYCGDELGNLKMLQLNVTEQDVVSSADLKNIELLTTGGVAPAAGNGRGSGRASLQKETKNNADNLTYASDRLLVTLVSINALGFSI